MYKKLIAAIILSAGCSWAGVSDISAVFRNGQVFIQWKENKLSSETKLAVYGSSKPITRANVGKAELLADMIHAGSSTDWWLDADNFVIKRTRAMREDEPFAGNTAEAGKTKKLERGFVITDSGKPIAAGNGLHVHTPGKNQTGRRYYAVVARKKGQICGFAALKTPVNAGKGKSVPIALTPNALKKNSCKGLPLLFNLHGRGGGGGVDRNGRALGTHIIYLPRELAWREGIPYKFRVSKGKNCVVFSMHDRIWIGRKMSKAEISDSRDGVKAISTFWMGYNPNIAKSIKGPKFVCDNFTERYLIHIVRWAQEYLGTDPAATYISGGSMGGSGAIQLATHYPDVFAAVSAMVPVYSYTWLKNAPDKNGRRLGAAGHSMSRIICSTGKFTPDNPALMPDGRKLEDYLNGAKNISRPDVDIPPIIATNGRQDRSIPWVNNPPFFRGANAGRQALTVYWNNGKHGMSKETPQDMRKHHGLPGLLRYRLDRSYPAFSNASSNKNYGNGNPADGDLAGWINRGFAWKVLADTPERYEIEISTAYPGLVYPVTADVTLRRRQNFKFPAGTVLAAQIGNKKSAVKIDKNKLLTLEKVKFNGPAPVKITIVKK